jgi:hypothetical protein
MEARWAKYFDEAGIESLYEPAGFKLSTGIMYMPDFYLTKQRRWVEVKFDVLNPFDETKADLLVMETGIPLIVLDGDPKDQSYSEYYLDEDGDIMSRRVNLVPEVDDEDSFLTGVMLESTKDFLEAGYEKYTKASKAARSERFGVHD